MTAPQTLGDVANSLAKIPLENAVVVILVAGFVPLVFRFVFWFVPILYKWIRR